MRVLLLLFTFVAAAWGQNRTESIIDYLRISYRHRQLLQYIEQAGLTSTLNGTGNYTVFAPYDSTFYTLDPSIKNDTAKLSDFVKYHIVSGLHIISAEGYNEKQLTTLQGSDIRINHYLSTGRTTIEGHSNLYGHKVSNGIVYNMYYFLTPPVGTVLDVIANDRNLTTLRKAVQTAGLDNFFQDQNPITLFAPTEKAFSYLPSDELQALLQNPALLASVLKYHVIPGTLYAAGYHESYMHTFEEADKLRLHHYYSSYEVEGAQIDRREQSASNGVVHQINEVLIPSSLADQVKALSSTRK